jgi:hypothetical protein
MAYYGMQDLGCHIHVVAVVVSGGGGWWFGHVWHTMKPIALRRLFCGGEVSGGGGGSVGVSMSSDIVPKSSDHWDGAFQPYKMKPTERKIA